MEIEGKAAVITGAGSGIGRATAVALAEAGADIVLADVNEERMAEALKEITALGRRAVAVKTDVSRLADVQRLFARSLETMGRVDILMNNAGVHMTGRADKIPISDWKWLLGINLWGVIHGVHVFLPYMVERGSGHIVNTASIAGLLPSDAAPYTVSKYAVVGLSEVLALYFRNRGIGVTVVCPALVATNIVEGARFVPSGDEMDAMRRAFLDAFKSKNWDAFSALDAVILTPEAVAANVVDAIQTNTFLVTPHPDTRELMVEHARDMDAFIATRAAEIAQREEMVKAAFAAMQEQAQQEGV